MSLRIEQLKQLGVLPILRGGRLRLSGPRCKVTPQVVALATSFRAELLAELQRVQIDGGEPHQSFSLAQSMIKHGFSVLPVKLDGTKSPNIYHWEPLQHRYPLTDELVAWFSDGKSGIGCVCGFISRNLEVLDFESIEVFEEWWELCVDYGLGNVLITLPRVGTPRPGVHIYYRCATPTRGGMVLAKHPRNDGVMRVLIETRGEGNYVVAPGSGPFVHRMALPYEWQHLDYRQVPIIDDDVRELFLSIASSMDRQPAHIKSIQVPIKSGGNMTTGDRPGDVFNTKANWSDILEPHGWKTLHVRQGKSYWQRPGKSNPGTSATTNHAGTELLYVFSTNAAPFEAGQSYQKFIAYAMLNHNGDCSAAARKLYREGRGDLLSGTS